MIFTIDVPIYRSHIAFLVETTLDEFDEFYQDNKDKLTAAEYDGIVKDIKDKAGVDGFTMRSDDGMDYVVYFRYSDKVGDVAHEIFHVANKILCSRGVTFDSDAEAWAYLIGWITEKFYDAIKEVNEKDDVD